MQVDRGLRVQHSRSAELKRSNPALALFGGEPVTSTATLVTWPVIDVESTLGEIGAVLQSGVLGSSEGVTGSAMARFETAFSAYVRGDDEEVRRLCNGGLPNVADLSQRGDPTPFTALMTTSGTSALQLALAAAGVQPGDRVIVPALSWIATAMAVVLRSATPVFVDVDSTTGSVSPEALAGAVRAANQRQDARRIKAAIVVHLHGTPCDLEPMYRLAALHGFALIEDAAQAHGALYNGERIGGISSATRSHVPMLVAFSLQQSKNLPAGEGGLFLTDCPLAAARARAARSFGLTLLDTAPIGAWPSVQSSPVQSSDAIGTPDAVATLDAVALQAAAAEPVPVDVGGMHRGSELAAAVGLRQLLLLEESVTLP